MADADNLYAMDLPGALSPLTPIDRGRLTGVSPRLLDGRGPAPGLP